MRRPLTELLALAGGAALVRRFGRRRRSPVDEVSVAPDPRALELRRKLAESRELVDERAEFEAGETPVDEAEDVDEKRRRVHERGRAAADEMRRAPDEPDSPDAL